MKYKFVKLSNGAQLAYVKNKVSKTTMVNLNFYSGARCDGEIPGLAHFVEHMFFTGTKTMNKDEITKKYFDFVRVNAHTSSNEICFSGNVFTKEFGDYLSTVAVMITESKFDKDAVDKEIGVVQQEIARYADKYGMRAKYFNDWNLYHTDVAKNYILGNKESVGSIKSKDVKNFVKKYFVANNLFACVSSPMPLGEVKRLVEKNLVSKLKVDNNFKQLPLFYGSIEDDKFFKAKFEDIKKNYVCINFVFDKNYLDIEYKEKIFVVLKMINDYSEGIMRDLRIKKSLVYSGGYSSRSDDKNTILTFDTECDKENVNEVIKTVSEYLNNLRKNGFTQSQLDKTKRKIKYSEHESEPRVSEDFYKLYDFKRYNRVLDDKKLKDIRRKVTLEEVNQIFRETFDESRVSASVYGNINKDELMTQKEFKSLFNKK